MKIAYCSDVHIEFGPVSIKNTENADVLILAGDIIVASSLFQKRSQEISENKFEMTDYYHQFFNEVCSEFKKVIYIMGNHEHYRGDFAKTYDRLKEFLGHHHNLHIMEKETITIDDVTFICGTMWTDFNNNNPEVKWNIGKMMNDFRVTDNSNRMISGYKIGKFNTEDAYQDHLKFLDFAIPMIDHHKNVVMVTHHGPSYICIPEEYKNLTNQNGGYVSNLSNLILDKPQIKAWVCGHSHNRIDEVIGSTRLLMNARGYMDHEPMADTFEIKYFEV